MNKNTVNFNADIAEYGLIALDEIDSMGIKELNVMKSVITASEISDKLVIKGSIKKPMPLNRLGMVLQQQGFRSKRINHGKIRGWIVRERDAEEVNANRSIEGRG